MAEFLSPAFEVDQVSEHTPWQVTLTIEAGQFDELRREYERSPRQTFDVFTLDDHFTQGEGWLRSNRQRVLWDSQYRVFYVVSEDGRRTEMVAPHPTVRYRVALMRIVREMATVHCSRQGMLHMHASSLCSGTNGLLISGPKRSGKTSLLMTAWSPQRHFWPMIGSSWRPAERLDRAACQRSSIRQSSTPFPNWPNGSAVKRFTTIIAWRNFTARPNRG